MKNIYQKMYHDGNDSRLKDNRRIKIMLSMIDSLNLQEANILDIGCYDGTFLSLIKNRRNNFFGLEASDWGFKKSREKEIQATNYFFNDADKMPYADNFFDVVIAGEIIEHIYDTDFFLQEISRVLKPGGKLILSTPNIASLGRRIFLLLGYSPLMEISPNEPESVGHIRYFTRETLSRLLKKHKFKIIEKKSDCVNFSKRGEIKSAILAEICPSLGGSIVVLAER